MQISSSAMHHGMRLETLGACACIRAALSRHAHACMQMRLALCTCSAQRPAMHHAALLPLPNAWLHARTGRHASRDVHAVGVC
eukprot:355872-Chlamydomonas_euryale.AAC.5